MLAHQLIDTKFFNAFSFRKQQSFSIVFFLCHILDFALSGGLKFPLTRQQPSLRVAAIVADFATIIADFEIIIANFATRHLSRDRLCLHPLVFHSFPDRLADTSF